MGSRPRGTDASRAATLAVLLAGLLPRTAVADPPSQCARFVADLPAAAHLGHGETLHVDRQGIVLPEKRPFFAGQADHPVGRQQPAPVDAPNGVRIDVQIERQLITGRVDQVIGDQDVVTFQLRTQPARESGREHPLRLVAGDQCLGGPGGGLAAGAGKDQRQRPVLQSALADDQASAPGGDHGLEQVFQSAGFDPQGKDQSQPASFRLPGGMRVLGLFRGGLKLLLRSFHDPFTDLAFGFGAEPPMEERAEDHGTKRLNKKDWGNTSAV